VAAYGEFGRDNWGGAFQVVDDIQGILVVNPAVDGKSAATDILTRKKTLPVLYAHEWGRATRPWATWRGCMHPTGHRRGGGAHRAGPAGAGPAARA
jgi:geranylgeranyl pyrophosphate synthase